MSENSYVIYCRKSTDESSEHQKQSIPDQIKACLDYTKREGLIIKERPKNFDDFESEYEVQKEDAEKDLNNRRIFRETRNLFIIKEQETGKIPGKRKKWRALIKLIKRGKVKGLISYSPDRQARNMLEGGELINCVDEGLVDLKYTNFHFENNASGKMMLGIWFVFSKQYSDKLSEDIRRGTKSKIASGKATGKYKAGYFINKLGYHEPDEKYFPLIKEAFKMKLDGVVESKIREFLTMNGYGRVFKKTGKKTTISRTGLNNVFRDEFYYGMLISGDTVTDLNEVSEYYKPMITKAEFQVLQEKYQENPIVQVKYKTKDDYEDIKVFDSDFLISEDNYSLTFTLANRKRYLTKIEKAKAEGKKLELKDVVKPNQIIYRCANKNSKTYGVSVTQANIDEAICALLKGFDVGKKEYKQYLEYANSQIDDIERQCKEKIASKNLEIGRIKSKKNDYIKRNMGFKKDKDEEVIYNKTKEDFDTRIRFLRKEIAGLDENERNEILEIEMFITLLNKAESFYLKANYVQKRKIIKILALNIKIDHEKRLRIQVKPGLETLFNPTWWSLKEKGQTTIHDFLYKMKPHCIKDELIIKLLKT